MKRLALALFLLAAPAMAQDMPAESITVYGKTLTGVWHGGLLQYVISSGFFSAPKLLGVAEGFCRIGPRKNDLEIYCLQGRVPATASTDGSHVRFVWGTILRGSVLDGVLASAEHFRGHYQFKRWGIAYDNPAIADAVRLTPDPDAPDKAGKATLLRRIFSDGLEGVPHDVEAIKKNGSALDLPTLGAIQAISYLGQETKWDVPPPGTKLDFDHLHVDDLPHRPDFFSVYDVEFMNGHRLCGLHQRDDGMLDGFRCV